LLDGDRISTLAASFIGELARNAGIANKLRIGVVQTAYANGSSTEYIEKVLKLPVVCTPTGVKHLHHAAMRFDVGVYFEANGHGTVTFSESAMKTIKSTEPQSPAQQYALESLSALTDLINQAVGDALSDLPRSAFVRADSKKASEPKRAKQDVWRESAESRMSSTTPPSSPVYAESEDEPFEEGPDVPSETSAIEATQVSANDESSLLPPPDSTSATQLLAEHQAALYTGQSDPAQPV
ncbi:Phosphoacetylglucosamine Mutase, partial [Ascosphaera atra]